MSYGYRTRIQELIAQMRITDMTNEEKDNPTAWCGISDDVIRELMKKMKATGTIDDFVDRMSDEDMIAVHQEVMRRFRKKRKAIQEQISGKKQVDDEAESREVEVVNE